MKAPCRASIQSAMVMAYLLADTARENAKIPQTERIFQRQLPGLFHCVTTCLPIFEQWNHPPRKSCSSSWGKRGAKHNFHFVNYRGCPRSVISEGHLI